MSDETTTPAAPAPASFCTISLTAEQARILRRMCSNAQFDPNMNGFDFDECRAISNQLPPPEALA